MPITGLRIRVRDLMIAVAIVCLLLGNLVYLLRNRPNRTRVTIRVFNRTNEEIGYLRYDWDTVEGVMQVHGEESDTIGIPSGGERSFPVQLPGPVDLTLSCSGELDRLSTAPVRVGAAGRYPDHVDFDIRPNGIIVRIATGTVQKVLVLSSSGDGN